MECRVLWWIFGGVAGVSPAEGVGKNVTQSENFAFIVAEGETFPSQILKKILRCLQRKSTKRLPSQCSRLLCAPQKFAAESLLQKAKPNCKQDL